MEHKKLVFFMNLNYVMASTKTCHMLYKSVYLFIFCKYKQDALFRFHKLK